MQGKIKYYKIVALLVNKIENHHCFTFNIMCNILITIRNILIIAYSNINKTCNAVVIFLDLAEI